MIAKYLSAFMLSVASFLGMGERLPGAPTTPPQAMPAPTQSPEEFIASLATSSPKAEVQATKSEAKAAGANQGKLTLKTAEFLSQDDLLALSGPLPKTALLGDGKYTTAGAKKGYIYLCNVPRGDGGGADGGAQSWIHGSTWTPSEKTIRVAGEVSWPQATFSNSVAGATRKLVGNGLPINHTTGSYPVSSSDPAYRYDRNPNSIQAQKLVDSLPADPVYSETPYCMGMESGVMLSGVPIFAGFDAELRDAPAYEVQDSCDGHPEKSGQYHYHSLSSCFKDTSVDAVLGYALDGFPITGPKVAEGRYLTTEDLDVCHGITSEVTVDGKKKATYHYVMTQDFPYSVSCFRGKLVSYSVLGQSQGRTGAGQGGGQTPSQEGAQRTPPQEATAACSGKSEGAPCSFFTPNGSISGICRKVPEGKGDQTACVPQR